MNAYDLAMDTVCEGRIHGDICEWVKYYQEQEAFEEFMKKDTDGLEQLRCEMTEKGYTLDTRNSVIELIKDNHYCLDRENIGEKASDFTLVEVYDDEELTTDYWGKKRNKKTTFLTFEDENGEFFTVELVEYRNLELDNVFGVDEYFLSDKFEIEAYLAN